MRQVRMIWTEWTKLSKLSAVQILHILHGFRAQIRTVSQKSLDINGLSSCSSKLAPFNEAWSIWAPKRSGRGTSHFPQLDGRLDISFSTLLGMREITAFWKTPPFLCGRVHGCQSCKFKHPMPMLSNIATSILIKLLCLGPTAMATTELLLENQLKFTI